MNTNHWQTWNVRSVLSHVRMPEAFGLSLGFFECGNCKYLREPLIGRPPENAVANLANDLVGVEEIHSQLRLIDAVYTEVTVEWQGVKACVRSGNHGGDLFLLIEPLELPKAPVLLTLEAGILWGRPGTSERLQDSIRLTNQSTEALIQATQSPDAPPFYAASGPSLGWRFTQPIGITTSENPAMDAIQAGLEAARAARDDVLARYGGGAELAGVCHSALGWTTVYNPGEDFLSIVCSRVWASRNGQGLLFCWDTFLAGLMAAGLGQPDLGLQIVRNMLDCMDADAFVPNVRNAVGSKTTHSQPPNGSMCLRAICEVIDDPGRAAPLLDALLTWNRWWAEHRSVDHLLCWGSSPSSAGWGSTYEKASGGKVGAMFESGLDNSPMYDDAVFDDTRGLLLLADVGLQSFYIRDCQDLAALMQANDRPEDAAELRARADSYATGLEQLWSEEDGIYLNYDLTKQALSPRMSPTNFYPLFTGRVSKERALRMREEHLFNPATFWGDHVLPSIARNDPAFADQSYWRGRIWAPMNFFVYWGLANTGFEAAAKALASKSAELLLRGWREKGHVGENYNALTGQTGDRANADPFNFWGSFLAYPQLVEFGCIPSLPKVPPR
ncbi:MAG: trehalase family glycosidase [Opitutales bacterium]